MQQPPSEAGRDLTLNRLASRSLWELQDEELQELKYRVFEKIVEG